MTKAIILAGGFGTRMRPLTINRPKPMITVANCPIMAHIINLLAKNNIKDIISLLYYQPEKIRSFFGDGKEFGINMDYFSAMADFGTAGSVKNVSSKLDSTFIIISGDVITDLDINSALKFHKEKKSKATLVLTRVDNPLQYGIVMTNSEGRIERFLEKPSWGQVFSDTVNTGIYILEPEIFDLIPEQEEFDFSKDLFPLMLEGDIPIYGYIMDGYWKDIGNLEEYQNVQLDILYGKVQVDNCNIIKHLTDLSNSNSISKSASISNSILGKNNVIGENVKIVNSILGDDIIIKNNATVQNSVIWNNCTIGSFTDLTDDIISENVELGNRVTLQENVVIADNCKIGDNAIITTFVKIWPNKNIENSAILFKSLVQNEQWQKEIFTDARVTGSANLDINPEFASKIGSALGMLLGRNTVVLASRDPDKVSRLIKRSIISGLSSVGVDVNDLQKSAIPQVRQELRTGKNNAGFHVRRSQRNINNIDIIILAEDGRDITISKAKKIERFFFGEETKRAHFDNVGNIYFPERTNEIYVDRYLDSLNTDLIKKEKFKILVDYSYGMVATTLPNILGQMNVAALSLHDYLKPNQYKLAENNEKEEILAIMKSLDYNLGFLLERGAEKLSVVSKLGKKIDNKRLLSIVVKLFLESHKGVKKIAISIAASSEIDMIASAYGVQVIRIKNSHMAMMEATKDKEIAFVGSIYGGFIFPKFLFASDGMFTIGKILEMLASTKLGLEELDKTLPKTFQEIIEVDCPWNKKGTVMRNILEYTKDKERVLIEGVKLIDKHHSILFLPEKEKSIFKIYIECHKFELIEELKNKYLLLVKTWIKD